MDKLATPNIAAISLPEGSQLTIVVGAVGTAIVERRRGDALLEAKTLASGVTHVFGEYLSDMAFRVSCIAGTLTTSVSSSTDQVQGRATQTNDDAPAGSIGEVLSTVIAVGNEVTLTTATAKSVATRVLTPGDWEVEGVVDFDLAGATVTDWMQGLSSTADTLGAQDTYFKDPVLLTTETDIYPRPVPRQRFKVPEGSTVTVQLVAKATFSVGTIKAFGTINARRMR